MNVIKKIFLLVVLSFSVLTSVAYAFQMESSQQRPDQEMSGERSVRGDFISLSPGRLLKTSVGEYSLSSLSLVDDRRLDQTNTTDSQVVITLQGDTVKHVVIY